MLSITGAGGHLEAALPGEWAALVLAVGLLGVFGGLILVAASVHHSRLAARRARLRARARARGAWAAPRGGPSDRYVHR
ncbi:MAG TPA: hypothetical protein VGZ32_22480 [Actinocrinis sp.]|jgi:hypothetical protein|uniref:hypothetical protein n=1 Tax=Actinocrinis sp. TaxID=1920516 RepID=UPI002DDDAE38|nr:hypothetical protein [Actinocrinis sp.]HEV3173131.1 hypothetical protein [Actinocrinis sp.]